MNKKLISNILVYIGILIIVLGFSFYKPVIADDESYNFQNINKIVNGAVIYKECNVIVTPLFFMITVPILKLIGCTLFNFRIVSAVLFSILFFVFYKMIEGFNIRKRIVFLITIITIFWYNIWIALTFSYNTLVVLFVLLSYVIIQKFYKEDKKYIWLQSIIWFLIFMSKQNVAILYGVALFFVEIFFSEKEFKERIKRFVKIGALSFIYVLVFLGILKALGILNDFIDYAVIGAKEFGTKNVYITGDGVILLLIELALTSLYAIVATSNIMDKKKDHILSIGLIAICMMGIGYPILNSGHMSKVLLMFLPIIIYIVNNYALKKEFKFDNLILNTAILCMLVIIGRVIYNVNNESLNSPSFSKGTVYENLKVYNMDTFKDMVSFLENNNSVMITNSSAMYMTYVNQNHSYFDLCFYGNVGRRTPTDVIDDINSSSDIEYVILKEKSNNDYSVQEITEVKDYVRSNMKFTKKIGEFEIYEK